MEQGQIVENENGDRLQLVGWKWVPLGNVNEQAARQAQRQAVEGSSNVLQGLGAGAAKALGSDYWGKYLLDERQRAQLEMLREARPISSTIGGAIPAIAAGMMAPPSVLAQGAVGAATGALADAQTPWQSAIMGGAIGAGAQGAVNLMTPAGRAAFSQGVGAPVGRAISGLGERATQFGMATPQFGIAARVQAGIEQRMAGMAGKGADVAAEGAEGARYYPGLLTVDEARATGLPLTKGDELMLQVPNADADRLVQSIRKNEELGRSFSGPQARMVNDVRAAQKQWLTQTVAREAGMNPEQALTPAALGQRFQELGRVFDEAASVAGRVDMPPEAYVQLSTIVENADTGHQAQLQRLLTDVQKHMRLNQDAIPAEGWQQIRTNLGNMIDAGTRQGNYAKISDASEFQQVLQEALEAALPDTLKAELATARQQYRVLKILTGRSGIISGDTYEVNATSLANALGRNPGRFKRAQDDPFYRAIDTLKSLQTLKVPNSGTADRMAANPLGAAQSGIMGHIGKTALGTIAGSYGANKLFGD